jgi:hypothetical protein
MAKLNKFFALKTNFQSNPDEIRSGAGGSNASTAKASPVFLDTYTKVQQQIDNLDAQLLRMFPDISAEEMEDKKVAARRELVALAEKNPAINFSQEDFLKAVGAVEGGPLTPAQALAQYYGIDLDETYGNNRLKIGGGGLKLTDNIAKQINTYAKENPDSGTFSTFNFAPPSLVEASDVEVETDFALPSATDLQTRLDAFIPRDRQMPNVTLSTPAFTVADKLGTTMFDRINFPERTINRGVPVVTKGIDAQGNPTTSITMGNAAASPSGPTIGDLDTSAVLPSTGMLVNADGTGGATVGTQAGSGNIVASSADTLNILDPGVGSNPVSSVDPNAVGLAGNQVASTVTTVDTAKICPINTELAGKPPAANGSCNPVADAKAAAAATTGGDDTTTAGGGEDKVTKVTKNDAYCKGQHTYGYYDAATDSCKIDFAQMDADNAAKAKAAQTADIQNLFTTSQTKDIAAQRIGDYAAQAGGITAEAIAEAVKPVLSQKTDFGINPNTGAADVLEAVDQFGYGTKTPLGMLTTGVDNYSTIYGAGTTPPQDLQQITGGMAPDLAGKQAALQFLNTQDAAIGTGPYTETEAAMRGLDYAKRNQMSLGQAGAAFDMTADDVRARADTLGIDLGAVGFAQGGEVEDSRDAAVGSRLMAHAGIGSMQGKSMSSDMAGTLDRIMARRK